MTDHIDHYAEAVSKVHRTFDPRDPNAPSVIPHPVTGFPTFLPPRDVEAATVHALLAIADRLADLAPKPKPKPDYADQRGDQPQEAASSHETPPSTPAGPQGGAVEPPPCDSQVVNLDQAKAAPEGVGSADRGLTHSLELTKEGLMPNRTHVTADESSELLDCIISATMGGAYYQAAARAVFEVAGDADLDPLVWIRTSCGNACLNAQHLIVHQPLRIAYPKGVCVYCGFPAGTKDHLIPRPWTGDTRRARVAVVPACAECNSRIGARGGFGIHERRKIAQDGLRKKHKNLLATPVWSEEDLSEMGPTLRVHIEESAKKRAAIQSRLAWPEDPFYDMRAWQKSGIDDPVALGAIAPIGQEAA